MSNISYGNRRDKQTRPSLPTGHRVLLVDDDREIVRGASLRLRAAGYDTITAADGQSGVATAVEQQPDAVVMDVRMPCMDGIEAVNALRNRGETKDIPIVMLSASLADQQRALDAGARFFVKKPYAGQLLVDAVKTAVAEKHPTFPFFSFGEALEEDRDN